MDLRFMSYNATGVMTAMPYLIEEIKVKKFFGIRSIRTLAP